PETLAGTDREPTADPESDPLDATESETIGIITDALADAGTGGLGGGRIMRIVKDTTGDGSHVFALLDEMDQTGIIRVDEKPRYYLTKKETAA
uniref:hypothetical protein n=1 Tax=Corynebacterium nuruki TaxID=1032851 RepID=UPI0039BFD56F